MSLIEKVVDGGYCIGCGACVHVKPEQYQMKMSNEGMWVADILENQGAENDGEDLALTICPMSGATPDEAAIAENFFPSLPEDAAVGRYRRNIVGHVVEKNFRENGGSGGLVTWLLDRLMALQDIDAVFHVRAVEHQGDGVIFEYCVSVNRSEIADRAKSRYYPIEMSKILEMISSNDRRYAFVGVPCFIKAIRLLQMNGNIPAGRVKYCIGLVCGHLKSRYFAEYLAWQKGTRPKNLAAIDFRHKFSDQPASQYGYSYVEKDSRDYQVYPMRSAKGRDWGEGLFKNPACEFCDDVLAECADIAVGDAWLPSYVDDPKGTNIAVIRNEALDRILLEAQANGTVAFEDVSPAVIVKSQDAGLRHRRQGLSHRLARRQQAGLWAPKKRVAPKISDDKNRRLIYDARLKIAEQGSKLFAIARDADDFSLFEQSIYLLISEYRRASTPTLFNKIKRKVINWLRSDY